MNFANVEKLDDGRYSIDASGDWTIKVTRLSAKEIAIKLLWAMFEDLSGLDSQDIHTLLIADATGLCAADARRIAKSEAYRQRFNTLLEEFAPKEKED